MFVVTVLYKGHWLAWQETYMTDRRDALFSVHGITAELDVDSEKQRPDLTVAYQSIPLFNFNFNSNSTTYPPMYSTVRTWYMDHRSQIESMKTR
jgi:hypothetical protein